MVDGEQCAQLTDMQLSLFVIDLKKQNVSQLTLI